jgi:hypothetical protein
MKWTARFAFAAAVILALALALGCGGDKKDNGGNGTGGVTIGIGTYSGTATVSYVKAGNNACVEFGPMEIPMTDIPVCTGDPTDATGGQGFENCTYNETSSGATFSCSGSDTLAADVRCTEAYQASGSVEKLSDTKFRMTMDYKTTVTGPAGCAEFTEPCTMRMVVTLERTSTTVDCTAAPRGVLGVLRAQGFGGLR